MDAKSWIIDLDGACQVAQTSRRRDLMSAPPKWPCVSRMADRRGA